MTKGYVHSIEIGSFVDGPGTRFVAFLSGCPLRCAYCHNPESWAGVAQEMDSAKLLERIARSAAFLRAGGGGVTVSGGEPLAQAAFAIELLHGAHAMGLHTALDTSGYLGERLPDPAFGDIDLVLLDIKAWDRQVYRQLTGVDLGPTLAFARRLSRACRPMWVRFVLVPGVTDSADDLAGLARFVSSLSSVERVEIVPFHQMGRHKWRDLGLEYRLARTPEASAEDIAAATAIFEAAGLRVGETYRAPCTSASGMLAGTAGG